MNFLSLSLLFFNVTANDLKNDQTALVPTSWTSNLHMSPMIGTTINEGFSENFEFNQDRSVAESNPHFFRTNVQGMGVKVNGIPGQQPKLRNMFRGSDFFNPRSSHSIDGASTHHLPMDSLPGLDLEIDAVGLGGIPPGVRIENRNGRPVVEITPSIGGLSTAVDLSFNKPKHGLNKNNLKFKSGTDTNRPSHSYSTLDQEFALIDPLKQYKKPNQYKSRIISDSRDDQVKANVSFKSKYLVLNFR